MLTKTSAIPKENEIRKMAPSIEDAIRDSGPGSEAGGVQVELQSLDVVPKRIHEAPIARDNGPTPFEATIDSVPSSAGTHDGEALTPRRKLRVFAVVAGLFVSTVLSLLIPKVKQAFDLDQWNLDGLEIFTLSSRGKMRHGIG